MTLLTKATDMARFPGDPTVVKTGPSSRAVPDRMAYALGWFSIGLGLAELLATRQLTRALGMEGKENLVRAYGVRELAAGMTSLSVDKTLGLWSRVAGDALDIATLLIAFNDENPKKRNVAIALGAVAGVTLLDIVGAEGLTVRHARGDEQPRDYSDRSGFPKSPDQMRGAAREAARPRDMKGPEAMQPNHTSA